MTPTLEAGSELDALIHERVMGIVWDESRCRICGWPLMERTEDGCTKGSCSMRYREHHGRADEPPAYSDNIRHVPDIALRLNALGWTVGLEQMITAQGFQWRCDLHKASTGDVADAFAREIPEALCIAALQAVAERDSDGSPQGEDAKRLNREATTARAVGIAQSPVSVPSETQK
jgi:hypothetical protein